MLRFGLKYIHMNTVYTYSLITNYISREEGKKLSHWGHTL